jgi:hypothetical protein
MLRLLPSANSQIRKLTERYLTARETLLSLGFADEADWQESRSLPNLSEREFLRQAAWTILASGFREATVRNLFPRISRAFLNWTNAQRIARNRKVCERNATKVFNYPGKIQAIGSLCERVAYEGFSKIRTNIQLYGIEFLQSFAFIGPITSYHLGKNIGLDLVKPDRHLTRLARATGFPSPTHLCLAIAELTGDKLAVVDIVLWRYATVRPDFLSLFRVGPSRR